MDEEAAKRGTTVYLVDKRIDMLPSLLGTSELGSAKNCKNLKLMVAFRTRSLLVAFKRRATRVFLYMGRAHSSLDSSNNYANLCFIRK